MRRCWKCETVYADDHVTICLACGSGTREHKPEAAAVPGEVTDVNKLRHRKQPAQS